MSCRGSSSCGGSGGSGSCGSGRLGLIPRGLGCKCRPTTSESDGLGERYCTTWMTTSTTTAIDRSIADECRRHLRRCPTGARWDELLDFARDAGSRIVFTVAYVRHTRDSNGINDVRDWDPHNVRRLLERTCSSAEHARRGTVCGLELGNELRQKGKVENVTRMVEAYRELGRMVDEIWGRVKEDGILNEDRPRPTIPGPASTGGGRVVFPHFRDRAVHQRCDLPQVSRRREGPRHAPIRA